MQLHRPIDLYIRVYVKERLRLLRGLVMRSLVTRLDWRVRGRGRNKARRTDRVRASELGLLSLEYRWILNVGPPGRTGSSYGTFHHDCV